MVLAVLWLELFELEWCAAFPVKGNELLQLRAFLSFRSYGVLGGKW